MKIEIIISIIFSVISVIALIISGIALYQTHLKNFKLFLELDKAILWIFEDNTLRIDLFLILINKGTKLGLLNNLDLKLKRKKSKEILFSPELIYKFVGEQYKAVGEWHSIPIKSRESKLLIVGLKSDINIKDFCKKNSLFNAILKIGYLKNLEKQITEIIEFELKFLEIPKNIKESKSVEILNFDYQSKIKVKEGQWL